MKKICLLAACLILAAATPGAPKLSTAELDKILRAAVAARRVPGIVAMVATADGIVYEGSFGMPKDTVFAIASMTKPVTSVAVLQLVESGKVKLDEPARTYVPELGKVQVLDAGKLRDPKSPITVRQLLTHTSGFGYEFMSRELQAYAAKGLVPSMTAGGDGFLKAPLLFDPGTRWQYGISLDWLGRLVERVSGQSLEAYFRSKIFAPLGMTETWFNVPAEKQGRLASAYQRKTDGGLAEQPRQPFKPVEFFSGGGGLYSTAADYLRFTRALMAGGQLGGRRVLRAETVTLMGQNQIGELALTPFSSVMPQFARDGVGLPGGLDKFGFGFAINSRRQEKGRGANTMSWAGIYNTFFWIDREKQVCAVLMTQMLPGLDDGPRTLLQEFDRAVYQGRE